MTLEDARNIATVAAAAVALIGVGPLFINLHSSSRSLRSRVYFDTLALLEGKDGEVRDLRKLLEQELKDAKTDGRTFDPCVESPEVKKKLDTLARVYDKVGLLVKHGVIPTRFLFDFYSRPIVQAWQHLQPLVQDERDSRVPKQPSHMLKFQILATGAALYRQVKYTEAPPFTISAEDREMWEKWRTWKAARFGKEPGA